MIGEVAVTVFLCWLLFATGMAAFGVLDVCNAVARYYRHRVEMESKRDRPFP